MNQEIEVSYRDQYFQKTIGWPSDKQFKAICSGNQLITFPITVDVITKADVVYGTGIKIIKGKTAQK